jgi:hypothetical protein
MNWGYKILTAFIIFCLTVIGFVVYFMNQKVDVVTDNYYEKELKYQDQINKVNRTRALKDSLLLVNTGKELRVTFPNPPDKTAKDFFLLYRPSDNKKDVRIPVVPDSNRTQILSIERLDKGYWKLQINWTSGGAEYYHESAFIVK